MRTNCNGRTGLVVWTAILALAAPAAAADRDQSIDDQPGCVGTTRMNESPKVYTGQVVPFLGPIPILIPTKLLSPYSYQTLDSLVASGSTGIPEEGSGVARDFDRMNIGYFELVRRQDRQEPQEDVYWYRVFGIAEGACLSLGPLDPTQ